jgi:hypothetical protein
MKADDNYYISPGDPTNIGFWASRFGISTRELYDAILYTGSIEPKEIASYLKKRPSNHSHLFGFLESIRNKIIFLN